MKQRANAAVNGSNDTIDIRELQSEECDNVAGGSWLTSLLAVILPQEIDIEQKETYCNGKSCVTL